MEIKRLTAEVNYNGVSSEMEYVLTNHFIKRTQQRAINEEQIKYALLEGEEVEKQGFLFYIVGDKLSDAKLSPQERKKLKNLVVVTSSEENVLVTSYRNNDPFKHIAKKPRRLVA